MSTNYYVRPPGTPEDSEGIHLGKSSIGWPFILRAYPDAAGRPAEITWDVGDFSSWMLLLDLGLIVNEYGAPVLADDLLGWVRERRRLRLDHPLPSGQFEDEGGYRFAPYEFC